jgi:hypothetical protein
MESAKRRDWRLFDLSITPLTTFDGVAATSFAGSREQPADARRGACR